ncbi:MAG: two-component system sensor histidine kinase NtrB [Gammaproteobacteria bacterium]
MTEINAARDSARQSERQTQTLMQAAPLGIFHADGQGNLQYVNDQWCEITGYSSAQALGSSWNSYVHPEDRARVTSEWLNAHREHRPFTARYRILRYEGAIIWVSGQTVAERETATGEVVGYVGTITNITEQKELEHKLLRQGAELCHAQRLIAVGELAGHIVHEVSQPFTSIQNYLEGANIRFSQHASNPEFTDVLKHLQALCEHTQAVLGNVRALVRKPAFHREAVDIHQLIQETLWLIEPEAVRIGVTIALNLDADTPMLWGNRIELQQLLLNVIRNGLQAMETVEAPVRQLTIATRLAGPSIEIRIDDNGIGFDEEFTKRLFQPFVTTKPEGLGLGLRICRTIVEAHGGQIEADGSPGRGATFRITLPIDRRDHERRPL